MKKIWKRANLDLEMHSGHAKRFLHFNTLLHKCCDQWKDVVCFVDYEKAFNRVQHDKLIKILQGKGVDDRHKNYQELILAPESMRKGRGQDNRNQYISIQRGVRQGCVLSPMLFNLYSDSIFKEALQDSQYGIKVNGEPINTIR